MDSKTETVSDNELIAQFMGFVQSKSSLGNTWEHPERMGIYGGVGLKLKYDTSWDWLMPVVEKIRKHVIENEPFGNEYYQAICNALIEIDIHDCHLEVVEFIKHFNSQSPDTIK